MSFNKEFDDCKNDVDRWNWIKNNQGKGLVVMLDNDDTFIVDTNDEDSRPMNFDHYLGWSIGVCSLLESIGIEAECV